MQDLKCPECETDTLKKKIFNENENEDEWNEEDEGVSTYVCTTCKYQILIKDSRKVSK